MHAQAKKSYKHAISDAIKWREVQRRPHLLPPLINYCTLSVIKKRIVEAARKTRLFGNLTGTQSFVNATDYTLTRE